LGLGTKWGFVRYWWVATKLALNVLLVAFVLAVFKSWGRIRGRRAPKRSAP
jgi:hypothetical protein